MEERHGHEVLIFGGSVVGRALELLLRGTDLDVRYLEKPLEADDESLAEARLLLIVPGIDVETRDRLVEGARGEARSRRVPILELISDGEEGVAEGHTLLLWPCPMDSLKRWISDLLGTSGHAGNGGLHSPAP